MKTAVMILAHGTKEPEASEPVFLYAKALAEKTGMQVVGCLREFIEPSIPTVTKELVEQGVNRVIVIPFFLFNSGHVTRDINKDLAAEKKRYPDVHFDVGQPIGHDPALVEVLSKRLDEVQAQTID